MMIALSIAPQGSAACAALDLLPVNAALVLGLMTALWALSVLKRDASIIDPWWSMAFLLVTGNTVWRTGPTPGKTLLLGLVSLWALRLFVHLVKRSIGKPEDPRYAAFRKAAGPSWWWKSLFQVFLLQGALVLIISAPLQVAAAAAPPDPVSLPDLVGALIFAIGFAFEAIGDAQLQAFRNDPSCKGKVLDSGLWHYTRHPNYFGEAVLWWGYWLFCLDQSHGACTVFGPILMTFLLLRVSGVTMLDAHLSATRPGYAEYVRRTSGFIPRKPLD